MIAVLLLTLTAALASPGAAAVVGEEPEAELADDADPAYLDSLLADTTVQRLWERREWRVLGHYKGRDLGRWRSQADSPWFFLADDGKNDPQAELRATLAAFFAPYVELSTEESATEAGAEARGEGEDAAPERQHWDQHPQCRFPARYRWLDSVLDFDPDRLPRRACPELEDWQRRLDVDSVTLIFADSYINNPASMFGHTFLRFQRRADRQRGGSGLLANSVNFAAVPWSENPLIYSLAGIVGWFPGHYSTLPYYIKVREYNALENRDLWEYPLLLDEQQIQRLVEHLWEVGPVSFNYHYFDENCSYQLLSLLEAMDPALRLTDRYTAWVFPTATLRTVVQHTGFVGQPRYRPSRYAEMVARRALLSEDERPLARELARAASPVQLDALSKLPPDRQVAVLDAAYELHRYRTKDAPTGDAAVRDQRLLVARGELGLPSPAVQIPPPTRPDQGHKPGMLALGAGQEGDASFLRLRFRPALHDLLASQQAYVPGTRLEMGHVAARVEARDDGVPVLRLEQLLLFDAASLAPSEQWVTRMAWRLRTGWERQRHSQAAGDCAGRGCLYYGLTGGPGMAVTLGDPLLVYGFVEGEAAIGSGVGRHLRVGPGVATGLLLAPGKGLRLHVEGRGRYPLWSAAGLLPGTEAVEWDLDSGLAAHLARDLELRLLTQWTPQQQGPDLTTGALEAWIYW